GRDLLGPVAYVDVDGTIAPTTGQRKQGMDMSYKGIWGYAPLIVSLANTREVVYLVYRPGNAPSHQDAATWIDKASDLVAPHAPRVCLRGDTDFSLTAHFDRWARRGVDFVFGMDASPTLRQRAENLDQTRWRRLHRPAPYQTATGTTRTRRPNHKKRIVRERGYLNLELGADLLRVSTLVYDQGLGAAGNVERAPSRYVLGVEDQYVREEGARCKRTHFPVRTPRSPPHRHGSP